MATRNTVKKPVTPAPQTHQELEQFATEISGAQRAVETIQLSANKRIEQIQKEAKAAAQPHQDLIAQRFDGVSAYAEAHRSELTDSGRTKTHVLSNGIQLVWRNTPPKVNVTKTETVLAALRKVKLTRFIRTKPEINKEAMLAEPEVARTVPGISITQQEEFALRVSTKVELTKKLKATSAAKVAA